MEMRAVISLLIASIFQIFLLPVEGQGQGLHFWTEMVGLKLEIKEGHNYTIPGAIAEGDNVTLSCNLLPLYKGNCKPYEIKFYRHDNSITNSTRPGIIISNDQLTFKNISKTDAAKYVCYCFPMDRKMIKSEPFFLKVFDRPIKENLRVSLQLKANTFGPNDVAISSDVYLVCKVTPDTTNVLKFRWFRGGVELQTNVTDGVAIKTSTLYMPRIQRNSSGTYFCQVQTDKNETLCSNPLNIGVFQRITVEEIRERLKARNQTEKHVTLNSREPAHAELGNGINGDDILEFDDVYFTCDIVQSNVTNIRAFYWIYKSQIVRPNDYLGIIYDNSTLIMKRVPKTATGYYTCIAETHNQTELYSSPVSLIVKDKWIDTTDANDFKCTSDSVKPFLDMKLDNEKNPDTIVEYDDVYFTCNLFPRGVASINTILWYHGENRLYQNETVGLLNGNSTLVLPRIGKMYAGKYKCEVDTDIGHFESGYIQIENVYDVSVKVIPTLTTSLGDGLRSDDIHQFDDVYIRCNIEPNLKNVGTIRWLRDGRELFEDDDKVEILLFTSILIIPNITKSAAGQYRCKVETKFGISIPILSEPSVEITVKNASTDGNSMRRPLVIAELVDYPETIYTNNEVRFYCHFHPFTTMVYGFAWWFYNDNLIAPGQNFDKYNHQLLSLTIRKVQKNDVGNYTCEIQTDTGPHTSVSAHLLKVAEKPRLDTMPWNYTVNIEVIAEVQDDQNDIHELENVFIFCNILPITTKYHSIKWFHDGVELSKFWSYIFKYSGQTAVWYGVEKKAAGNYSCQVVTDKGTVFTSGPTTLKIKDKRPHYLYSDTAGVPTLFAQLGDPMEANNIHENDNIYLTCTITPNTTTILELHWLHDGDVVHSNPGAGIAYIDMSLYFYGIKRSASGGYKCRAVTKKGIIESEAVGVYVKHAKIKREVQPFDTSLPNKTA